jgi:selenocysteine-specific elongation factor
MKNIIVGLAGHIDHGKTSLIKAINGYEGDSTKEEIERKITIDLSFSNYTSGDKNIAFIDVPGHERLVKNMISGAFGYDIVLLCIASDDGVMPQTIEHIKICKSLGIKDIVVAITKKDLNPNIDNLIVDIKENLKDFNIIDIVPTSTNDSDSIEKLKTTLLKIDIKKDTKDSFFKMYVDRVFSKKGFGCVVTGTLISGSIESGSKVYITDISKEATIKSIQIHQKEALIATPQNRVAINLNTKSEIKKGYLLSQKGYLRNFDLIEAKLTAFENIKHNQTYQLLIGSKTLTAQVLIYNSESISDSGYAKLKLSEPISTSYNEPFILRSDRSVGGGRVLLPISDPIKKAQKLELLNALDNKDFAKSFEILANAHKKGFGLVSSNQRFGLSHDDAIEIANTLTNRYIVDKDALVIYKKEIIDSVIDDIKSIYNKNKNSLLSTTSYKKSNNWCSQMVIKSAFDTLIESGEVVIQNNLYLSSQNSIDNIEEYLQKTIYEIIDQALYTPLAPYNIYANLNIDNKAGDNALKALTKAKKVIRLQHNLFVSANTITKLIALTKEIIKQKGHIDIKILKENLPISRKYLIAYLDYIDKLEYIQKDGDKRYLKY